MDAKQKRQSPLVKSSPASLAEAYRVMDQAAEVAVWFERLKYHIVKRLETIDSQLLYPIFKEAGRLNDGNSYLYLKPVNKKGWLIEAKESGWSVSRAEKITERDFFLRNARDIWDQVLLLKSHDSDRPVRVSSEQFPQDYLLYGFYEKTFSDELLRQLLAEE